MIGRIGQLLIASALLNGTACADDWAQFLGPHRNGHSAEKGLIDTFPQDGPAVVWRTALGVGMSGIAIADGTAFTLYQDDDDQFAVALDAASGKPKWHKKLAAAYMNGMGNGPRATPTVSDGKVFVFTGEGILSALNAESGEVAWSVNAVSEAGGEPAEYGMASSPLVIDKTVVVHAGGETGSVAAFNVTNGKKIWQAGTGAAGYSAPLAMTLSGRKQVVSFVGTSVLGIDPASGKVLWQHPWITDYECNIAGPVALSADSLLISSGENHGAAVLKIAGSGDSLQPEVVWQSEGPDSVLRAEWQTPVLIDGYLYGMDNIGSAGPITNLVCVRASDGEQVWRKDRFGKSNLIAADGKLFISTMKGELVIVKATPDGFTESARAEVLGMTRQAPAISGGRLYLRDDQEVVCLDVRRK
ncbi:MAG: PQQ-binding-like beta-propeller repeat protein [Planctomycetaceae bacterium]